MQLAAARIEPRVCRHRLAAQLPAEIPFAARFERARIELHRAAIFLQCQEPAGVKHRRSVVHAAVLATHAWIVRVRTAIETVQRAPRLALVVEALAADVTLPEVDVAIFE